MEIADHLQADFKVLIQYGNEARGHYGKEVRRSVRFFEEDLILILHLGLLNEARELEKFQRQRADSAMKKTLLSSTNMDESLLQEAAAKAFVSSSSSSPLTGSNAIPVTSTPTRPSPEAFFPPVEEDEAMQEERTAPPDS